MCREKLSRSFSLSSPGENSVVTRGAAHTVIKNHVSPLGPTLSTDGKHKSSPDRMIDVYLIETQLYKDDAE